MIEALLTAFIILFVVWTLVGAHVIAALPKIAKGFSDFPKYVTELKNIIPHFIAMDAQLQADVNELKQVALDLHEAVATGINAFNSMESKIESLISQANNGALHTDIVSALTSIKNDIAAAKSGFVDASTNATDAVSKPTPSDNHAEGDGSTTTETTESSNETANGAGSEETN